LELLQKPALVAGGNGDAQQLIALGEAQRDFFGGAGLG
jgi:hypothetical protein